MRMTNPQDLITVSIVGAGSRAGAYINALEANYHGKFKVVAIAEPRTERQKYFQEKYLIPNHLIFGGYEEFIKQPRLSDIVIIATLDDMHYVPVMDAIQKGYDIILEKPIAMSVEETVKSASSNTCIRINDCGVPCLEHSPFFRKIRNNRFEVLGSIIDIQHNENVSYYHFAHSYVHGLFQHQISHRLLWRNRAMIWIFFYIYWVINTARIASMGSLAFFSKRIIVPM